jgi:hypothetical protein
MDLDLNLHLAWPEAYGNVFVVFLSKTHFTCHRRIKKKLMQRVVCIRSVGITPCTILHRVDEVHVVGKWL